VPVEAVGGVSDTADIIAEAGLHRYRVPGQGRLTHAEMRRGERKECALGCPVLKAHA